MKRIIIGIALATAMLCGASAQNRDLQKWTKEEMQIKSEGQTENKKETKKTSFIGAGIGFTSSEYIPLSIHYTRDNIFLGLGMAFPISKGVEGEKYSNINWDEFPNDLKKEGSYCTSITFDIGYDFNNITLGVGIGLGLETRYRNQYDNKHILGDNGYYYIESRDGSKIELKVFAKYRFPSSTPQEFGRFYISPMFSIRTGAGVSIGLEI